MHVVGGPICACHGQREVGWVSRGDAGHTKATHKPEEGILLLCRLGKGLLAILRVLARPQVAVGRTIVLGPNGGVVHIARTQGAMIIGCDGPTCSQSEKRPAKDAQQRDDAYSNPHPTVGLPSRQCIAREWGIIRRWSTGLWCWWFHDGRHNDPFCFICTHLFFKVGITRLFSSSRVWHRSRYTLRMLRNATSRGLARWGKTFNLHPLTLSYPSLHGADTYSGGSILEGLHRGVTFAGFPRTKPSRCHLVAEYSRNYRD